MKFFKLLKVNNEDREFMYLYSSKNPAELAQFKKFVKSQGDIYRTTKRADGTITLWDARV